jgi:hypothetical protein
VRRAFELARARRRIRCAPTPTKSSETPT